MDNLKKKLFSMQLGRPQFLARTMRYTFFGNVSWSLRLGPEQDVGAAACDF